MKPRKFFIIAMGVLITGSIWFFANENLTQAEASLKEKVSEHNSSKPDKGEQGIDFFEGSWKEAKQEAREKEKPIFVDAYTTWCGPCKMMDKRVFPRKEVGKFYNKKFINFRFDMESKNGKKFRRKYGVKGYPSFFYFNKQGDKVHQKMGYLNPPKLIRHGKKALTKMD